MTSLLDVNVLLALLDEDHTHHQIAKKWFISQPDPSWASCPITQNGFIRIISQPSYPGHLNILEATAMLAEAIATNFHSFWSDDFSFLDNSVLRHSHVHGPKQVSDAYLLALAVKNGGQLVALDRGISTTWVINASKESLIVL